MQILGTDYNVRLRAIRDLMLCKFWALTIEFFSWEMEFQWILQETCYRPLCWIFQSLTVKKGIGTNLHVPKSKILCKAADLNWLSVLEKGVCSDLIKQHSHLSLRWQQAKAWKWPLAWFWIDWSPSLQLILLQMKSYMDVWKQCRGLHWLFSISRYFLSNLHRPLKIIIFCYYWSIIHRAEVGFKLETNCFPFYAIANLDKT